MKPTPDKRSEGFAPGICELTSGALLGVGIRGTLGDIDPLNKRSLLREPEVSPL